MIALAWAALVWIIAGGSIASAQAGLSIKVEGNHFVNGAGQTIRLLGVNHPSFEYACDEGFGYNDGHMDQADAAAIASWNASAVRVPLNEDCWLGLNGDPNSSQGAEPPLTQAGYQQAVEEYVADLGAHGLYAILDLHWTAPGPYKADGQRPMPDDHSSAFWTSVATTFKSNPAVVFDLFNEPYSPAAVNDPGYPVSWECWRDGGCPLPSSNDQTNPPNNDVLYAAVGMQTLLSTVRATGATQPVLIGGLSYANDLSQWLQFEPSDPLGQVAASFHNYQGEACATAACWNQTIAPVAAKVPVVTGEFDEEVCTPNGFDNEFMSWADQHGVGYLAWGWWVLSPQEIADRGCGAYYLLTNYNGTPAAPNGTSLHDHLLTLPPGGSSGPTAAPGGGKPQIKLLSFHAHVKAGDAKVAFELRSTVACAGNLSGKSAKALAIPAGHKRHKVALGKVGFKLAARKSKTVVLKLSKAARQLLVAKDSLKSRFTLTLTSAQSARTVLNRSVTLKAHGSHHQS